MRRRRAALLLRQHRDPPANFQPRDSEFAPYPRGECFLGVTDPGVALLRVASPNEFILLLRDVAEAGHPEVATPESAP